MAAGVDAEDAGVGVVRRERVDGVGETALLADLLEQPRRHPAAERGVEHTECEAAVVEAMHAWHTEHEVGLLGRTAYDDVARSERGRAATDARRSGWALVVDGHVGERLLDQPDEGVVVEVAGGGDDERVRTVAAPVVAGDRRAAHRPDRLDTAENRAPQRCVRPDGARERVVDRIARVVVVHGDLFEDHAALAVDVVRYEQRRRDHVADDVDGERHVDVQHPRVVAGVLLGGERVELTADRIELGRDRQRVASPRALEQQVLEIVRRAGQRDGLVARADADPDTEGDGSNSRHGLGQHAQPARQDRAADHSAVRSCREGARAAGTLDAAREVDRHDASYSAAGWSPSAFASPDSSTTGTRLSLPRGSISPISTCTFSPILSTSSTFSTRLPPASLRICEMCSSPSLPGVSEMNAPNVVVLTTVPR